jgi:hypothetical protein
VSKQLIQAPLVRRGTSQKRKPHIRLRREGKPGAVPVYLNEVRYLADAMLDMAAQIAGHVVGDDE